MKKKFSIILLFVATLAFNACDSGIDEPKGSNPEDNLSKDTYQEDKRSFSSEKLEYAFDDDVRFLSDYQKDKLLRVEKDSVLCFPSSLESGQLPKMGEIVVVNELTDEFPKGFVGRVCEINNSTGEYKVKTTYAAIDEIFSELKIDEDIDVSSLDYYDEEGNKINASVVEDESTDDGSEYVYTESVPAAMKAAGYSAPRASGSVTIAKKKWSLTFLNKPNAKIKGTFSIGGAVDAKIDISDGYFMIEPKFEAGLDVEFSVDASYSQKFDDTKKLIVQIPVRIPQIPILTFPVNIYNYHLWASEMKLAGKASVSISPSFRLEYNDGKVSGKPRVGSSNKFFDGESGITLSGKVSYTNGLRVLQGIGLAQWTIFEFKNIYVDGNVNVSASTSVDLVSTETGVFSNVGYQALDNASIEGKLQGGLYVNTSGFLRLFSKKKNGKDNYEKTLSLACPTVNLFKVYLLPSVSDWDKKITGESPSASALLSYKLGRKLLMPVSYGMALYKNGSKVETYYETDSKYWGLFSSTPTKLSKQFSSLGEGDYTAYAVFKFLGIGLEMQCPQGCDFTIGEESGEWVDLGLPSGTLWATKNVGATTPEGYGDYFAWGETSPKSEYTWDNYTGKDITSDELPTGRDAATANWGSNWRTPSLEQIKELINDCGWTWTSKKGVNGQLGTSKYNNKTIFLPAAGYRVGTSLNYVGASGYYWSRTHDAYGAYSLYFNSGEVYYYNYYDSSRRYGHSVRAVRVSKN